MPVFEVCSEKCWAESMKNRRNFYFRCSLFRKFAKCSFTSSFNIYQWGILSRPSITKHRLQLLSGTFWENANRKNQILAQRLDMRIYWFTFSDELNAQSHVCYANRSNQGCSTHLSRCLWSLKKSLVANCCSVAHIWGDESTRFERKSNGSLLTCFCAFRLTTLTVMRCVLLCYKGAWSISKLHSLSESETTLWHRPTRTYASPNKNSNWLCIMWSLPIVTRMNGISQTLGTVSMERDRKPLSIYGYVFPQDEP